MASVFELSAQVRDKKGKNASRRLRRIENQVPGVVYGADKASVPIMVDHNNFYNMLKNEAVYSHILTLHLDGSPEKVVLKALQRHPSRPRIVHVDFMRISATEKLYMNTPLRFMGEEVAPGVKMDGGIISRLMNEVEIRCLPADLPEFIEVDLSNLGMDETIHLSDLKVPKGVELVALIQGKEQDQPIVNIHKLQVIEEPTEIVVPSAEVPTIGEEEKAEEAEE